MPSVIAQQKGYFGGVIREPGATFHIPDGVWNDERRRPSWVILAGKGEAAAPAPEPAPAAAGDDLSAMTLPELRTLATDRGVDLGSATRKAEIILAIEAAATGPFGDAPAPQTVQGNGMTEALGNAQPDWIDPNSGMPTVDGKPVKADDDL